MKYNQLGRTGLFVSEICLGAMTFGGAQVGDAWRTMGALEQDAVDAIVGRSLAAGVNFIDTADVYALGESERLLGQALKNLGVARKDVVLATKVYGNVGPGPNDRGASRGHIMDAVKGSLERLQTDHIDLYQIHQHDTVTPLDEILRALDDLVSEGLVRYVGVSNWSAWRISKALGICAARDYARIDTLQAYYSIAGRDLERELVPMMNEEGVGLMVWSPLASGLLSGKYHRDARGPEGSRRNAFPFPPVEMDRAWKIIDVLREVAAARGVSVAKVALAWLLAKPHVMSVIIGAKTAEQLDDNLGAVDVSLTGEDMARLDEVSALAPEYPAWMFSNSFGPGRVPAPFKPA